MRRMQRRSAPGHCRREGISMTMRGLIAGCAAIVHPALRTCRSNERQQGNARMPNETGMPRWTVLTLAAWIAVVALPAGAATDTETQKLDAPLSAAAASGGRGMRPALTRLDPGTGSTLVETILRFEWQPRRRPCAGRRGALGDGQHRHRRHPGGQARRGRGAPRRRLDRGLAPAAAAARPQRARRARGHAARRHAAELVRRHRQRRDRRRHRLRHRLPARRLQERRRQHAHHRHLGPERHRRLGRAAGRLQLRRRLHRGDDQRRARRQCGRLHAEGHRRPRHARGGHRRRQRHGHRQRPARLPDDRHGAVGRICWSPTATATRAFSTPSPG